MFLPAGRFDPTEVKDALAEPLEDVIGIQRLPTELEQQLKRDRTGNYSLRQDRPR